MVSFGIVSVLIRAVILDPEIRFLESSGILKGSISRILKLVVWLVALVVVASLTFDKLFFCDYFIDFLAILFWPYRLQ